MAWRQSPSRTLEQPLAALRGGWVHSPDGHAFGIRSRSTTLIKDMRALRAYQGRPALDQRIWTNMLVTSAAALKRMETCPTEINFAPAFSKRMFHLASKSWKDSSIASSSSENKNCQPTAAKLGSS